MPVKLGSRLIWQSNSPAPFESAWTIFAKLLALSGMKPNRIASYIADSEYRTSTRNALRFRDSSWIDFGRFSDALGVDQGRLRLAFLDQIGINVNASNIGASDRTGIKVCMECLKKGYHCVFFELGFIDMCPWHRTKLESPCVHCFEAVSDLGLTKAKLGNKHASVKHSHVDPPEWEEWQSRCGHIYFNEGKVGRINELTAIEENVIAKSCMDLLIWCQKVSQNLGIAAHLLNYSYTNDELDHINKYLNAAENIAGPCPWPVGQLRLPIRCQRWMQHDVEKSKIDDRAPRKSEWDIVYRSIRRHIFNRYVRQHRVCWNELSNYRHADTQKMNSDAFCPVAVAYASWRLSIEQFITIEALKVDKLRNHPIKLLRLASPEFETSLISNASLLYVYFFHIWEEILLHAGKDSFAISNTVSDWYVNIVTAMFIPMADLCEIDRLNGEWSLIFPEYKYLEEQSFINCCGRPKKRAWMLYPYFEYFWGNECFEDKVEYGDPLFKLKKFEVGKRNANYWYINM